MKAPEKIYLQVCGDCQINDCEDCKFEDLDDSVTWCKDRIYDKDIEYTRTDAFIEKACNFIRNCTVYDGLGYKARCVDVEKFRKYMKE